MLTEMLLDPATTWLLVRISPVELTIMPVPAAWPLPRVVLMSTIAGRTLFAIASVPALPLLEVLGLGLTCVMGDSGSVDGDAWATGWLPVTTRARSIRRRVGRRRRQERRLLLRLRRLLGTLFAHRGATSGNSLKLRFAFQGAHATWEASRRFLNVS